MESMGTRVRMSANDNYHISDPSGIIGKQGNRGKKTTSTTATTFRIALGGRWK